MLSHPQTKPKKTPNPRKTMIHLLNYACPLQHSIMACAWDSNGEHSLEEIQLRFVAYMKQQGIVGRCAICGSLETHFDDRETKFKTLEEASPHVAQEALKQLITRAMLEASGKMFDHNSLN